MRGILYAYGEFELLDVCSNIGTLLEQCCKRRDVVEASDSDRAEDVTLGAGTPVMADEGAVPESVCVPPADTMSNLIYDEFTDFSREVRWGGKHGESRKRKNPRPKAQSHTYKQMIKRLPRLPNIEKSHLGLPSWEFEGQQVDQGRG